MIETTTFQTIYCDVPACPERLTGKNYEFFLHSGWDTIRIFSKEICLCPKHNQYTKDFYGIEKANDTNSTTPDPQF